MDRTTRFAPFSSERSTRLKLVAGYFGVNGAVLLALLAVALVVAMIGADPELRATLAANPLGASFSAIYGALYLLVARLLWMRSRKGGILAAVLLALSILGWFVHGDVSGFALLLSVVGLALIVSVWDELRGSGSLVATARSDREDAPRS